MARDTNTSGAPSWLRFRLRTLLIAVALVSTLLALYVNRLRRHREAIVAVQGWEGWLWYEHQVDWSDGTVDADAKPDFGLRGTLFGDESYLDLDHLTIQDDRVTDADLSLLGEFRNLRVLSLSAERITDDGLENIRSLKGLKQFTLTGNSNVTDACLANLEGMEDLEQVSLRYLPKITQEAVLALKRSRPQCTIRYAEEGQMAREVYVEAPHFRETE